MRHEIIGELIHFMGKRRRGEGIAANLVWLFLWKFFVLHFLWLFAPLVHYGLSFIQPELLHALLHPVY